MTSKGYGDPTPQELADGGSRVELYSCDTCEQKSRFPRYHSKPSKLLQTRKGRCGEWANCFALILRTMGYDTRRVLDWTDHVWCEVYTASEKRWLHVDPCENLIDKPLVYEKGWGKKLSYIIATSKDEVQDVSWRYSADHPGLRLRRTQVREPWLTKTLLKFTDQCQTTLTEEQKKALTERRLLELVELMSTPHKKVAQDELQGRSSGSLSWRLARGEQGSSEASSVSDGYTWNLSDSEKESLCFHLEYNVVTDEYTRVSSNNEKIKAWKSGAQEFQNIMRKEEKDWKMVYLSRQEGTNKASISWSLDLSETDLKVKSVELDVSSKTYESGRVIWTLCGGKICLLPQSGTTLRSEGLNGSKKVTLSAALSGGVGDVAWQHTQLFRTSSENSNQEPQLKLIVKLQKD